MRLPNRFRGLPLIVLSLTGALVLQGCTTPLGASLSQQGGQAFANENEFRRWFAFYYQNPEPERLSAALDFMARAGYLDERGSAGPSAPAVASTFLSRVLQQHPERMDALVTAWQSQLGRQTTTQPDATLAEKQGNEKQWAIILTALWMVDSDAARSLAKANRTRTDAAHQERLDQMLAVSPDVLDPLKADVVDPRQISLIWAAFSATGDDRYIEKIIGYVHLYGDERDKKSAIGEAAIMTLAANSVQDTHVEQHCRLAVSGERDQKTRFLLQAMFKALADIKDNKDPAERGLRLPSH